MKGKLRKVNEMTTKHQQSISWPAKQPPGSTGIKVRFEYHKVKSSSWAFVSSASAFGLRDIEKLQKQGRKQEQNKQKHSCDFLFSSVNPAKD